MAAIVHKLLTNCRNYWCIYCDNYRTHEMITEEKGKCRTCGKYTWAPTGEGGP